MFLGILTLTDFVRKYKLNEKQKTELITMQAFHQGIGMLIGAGGVLFLQFAIQKIAEML
jgi:hypothetical protein